MLGLTTHMSGPNIPPHGFGPPPHAAIDPLVGASGGGAFLILFRRFFFFSVWTTFVLFMTIPVGIYKGGPIFIHQIKVMVQYIADAATWMKWTVHLIFALCFLPNRLTLTKAPTHAPVSHPGIQCADDCVHHVADEVRLETRLT